jgi:hypothetical protein
MTSSSFRAPCSRAKRSRSAGARSSTRRLLNVSFQRSRVSGGTRSAIAFATSFSSWLLRTSCTNSASVNPISSSSNALKPGVR